MSLSVIDDAPDARSQYSNSLLFVSDISEEPAIGEIPDGMLPIFNFNQPAMFQALPSKLQVYSNPRELAGFKVPFMQQGYSMYGQITPEDLFPRRKKQRTS